MRAANTRISASVSTRISCCQHRTHCDIEGGVELGTDHSQDEHYYQNTDPNERLSPKIGNLANKYRAHGMIPAPLDMFSKHTSS